MTDPSRDSRSFAMRKLAVEHWFRRQSVVILNPIARLLSKLGLTPNALTAIGFLINVVVASVLARGSMALGGWLLLLASAFDALDGTLARLTGRQSPFGAFFDSTVDRFSEAVVYGGILYYFVDQGVKAASLSVYVAIIGSLMVSYTRARAEGLGIECRVGLATRADRLIILAIGLVLGAVKVVLWLVAILALLTSFQRMIHVRRTVEKMADSS